MPVTTLRIQQEFRMGPDGWSEIIWHAGSSPKEFKTEAEALVRERLKCLVAVGSVHHVRVSGMQPGAKSYRFPITNGQGGVVPSKKRDVGPVTTTVGLYGANGAYRKLMLHGLPDSDHRFNEAGIYDSGLSGAVETYIRYLKTNGYGIRTSTKAVNDATLKEIEDITALGNVVTFKMDATGLAKGQKVRINSAKGFFASQFNGVWTVKTILDPVTNGFTATASRGVVPGFFYVGGTAKVRNGNVEGYAFEPIDSWDTYEGVGSRKTGRPTDLPRGRRSNRR